MKQKVKQVFTRDIFNQVYYAFELGFKMAEKGINFQEACIRFYNIFEVKK